MTMLKMQLTVAILALSLSAWFAKCQWDECRDAGMSRLYCLKHIE